MGALSLVRDTKGHLKGTALRDPQRVHSSPITPLSGGGLSVTTCLMSPTHALLELTPIGLTMVGDGVRAPGDHLDGL